jgi:Ca2+/Na+ antiporter
MRVEEERENKIKTRPATSIFSGFTRQILLLLFLLLLLHLVAPRFDCSFISLDIYSSCVLLLLLFFFRADSKKREKGNRKEPNRIAGLSVEHRPRFYTFIYEVNCK